MGPVARYALAVFLICARGLSAGHALAAPRALSIAEVRQQFEIRSWGTEDGLPDARVMSVTQTSDGFLWAGTQRGLARFDGVRFTVFNRYKTPDFTDDYCVELVESRAQELWVAAKFGVFRKTGNRFIRKAAQWAPMCMAPSLSGGVWVGVKGNVLAVDPDSDAVRVYPVGARALRANAIRSLVEDEAGILWIASAQGVFRLEPGQSEAEPVLFDTDFERLRAFGICRTRGGQIWSSLSGLVPRLEHGVACYDAWLACLQNGVWKKTPDFHNSEFEMRDWSAYLVEDRFGALWFPSNGGGLHRYRAGDLEFLPFPDSKTDCAVSAFCDREGSLWFGTSAHGVQQWIPRRIQACTTREGLVHDEAWTLCEADDGGIWIGTGGGISRLFNGQFENYAMPADVPGSSVRSIVQDSAGTIWFGTIRALHKIAEGQVRTLTFPGDWFESKVRVLLPSRAGGMWVGTVTGLYHLTGGAQTKYSKADGLASGEVRALLEDRNGSLWIGTFGGGLSRLHEGRFTTLTRTNGLSNDNVWALHQDEDGILWAGTENGLNRIDGGSVATLGTREGLPSDLINCILEDRDGRLWISCNRGIYWVPKRELEDLSAKGAGRVAPVLYTQLDGLPCAQTNGEKSNPAGCRGRDGRLWFPTPKGIVVIDPTRAVLDVVPPSAVIESIRADGRIVAGSSPDDCELAGATAPLPEPTGLRDLSRGGVRVLEFRYTATTFSVPEKARFKYRLLGLADSWIDAGTRREAYFTDLHPGKYRFEVIAANHRGLWQTEPAAVSFVIEPFFFQAWWFGGLCLLALAVAVYGLARWRLGEVRRIQALEHLNELNEQRKKIGQDIHDDLGGALTRILQIIRQPLPENLHKPASERDRYIAAIAEEAVDHIGDIVWAYDPEYDTLEDLILFVREHSARFFEQTPIHVQLEFPGSVPARTVTGTFRRHLLMIVKESLQNVLKHAEARTVRIALAVDARQMDISIQDNGVGFDGSGNGNGVGNGLSNMRQRAAELGGAIKIRSEPGRGTRIHAFIPLPAPLSEGRWCDDARNRIFM